MDSVGFSMVPFNCISYRKCTIVLSADAEQIKHKAIKISVLETFKLNYVIKMRVLMSVQIFYDFTMKMKSGKMRK